MGGTDNSTRTVVWARYVGDESGQVNQHWQHLHSCPSKRLLVDSLVPGR